MKKVFSIIAITIISLLMFANIGMCRQNIENTFLYNVDNPCADLIGISKFLVMLNFTDDYDEIAKEIEQEFQEFSINVKIKESAAKKSLFKPSFILFQVRKEVGPEGMRKIRDEYYEKILPKIHKKCLCKKTSWKQISKKYNPFYVPK